MPRETTLASLLEQSNAAPKVSKNKRVQDAQAFWEDDDEDGAKSGQRFSNVRKKIKTNLTAHVKDRHKGAELDYLIKTTQALVTSNNEIWDRCKANFSKHENKQFNHLSEKPNLIFQRVGFSVVNALSRTDGYGRSLAFLSQCVQKTKAFSVPCFPHPLRTVVIPSLDKYGMLNYSEYLKRSFILEESIMLPFLAILKDHLEEFQVFLGNVESWLMKSTRNTIFLENTFNATLAYKQIGAKYLLQITKNRSNDESQYNLSFNVSSSKGREELIKFLAFIAHVE